MSTLKYPVLMVHGMGFRDRKHLNYWGRIPAALEKEGCTVYYGGQDSCGSAAGNGKFLAERIEQLAKEHNIEKFNVIAHSKGGLDMRYAMSTLGMGKYVASISTINTPHNGSITVDKLTRVPDWLLRFACKCSDIWFKILGDEDPQIYKAVVSFKTKDAEKFNLENPDVDGVYYQSFAFVCKHSFSDFFLWITHMVVHFFEGENDGLLTPRGVRWTNFRGIYRSSTGRGISHCDEVDMRRRPFSKKKNGEGISDIVDFYVDLVKELGQKGF